ncbi:MAG: hypothetical protein WC869_00295 [Phycisphaerae bacterium]|jgi:hypothetical protein
MTLSTYTFNLHRPGAIAERDAATGRLIVTAVSCVEFLAPGRVPSLSVRGDLPLKPGVIYKAFTGVSAAFPFPFLGCMVRAAMEAWRFGVEVKRIDFGENSELIIYFTVLEQLRLDQAQLRFEISHDCLSVCTAIDTVEGGRLSLPGIKIAIEPVSARRVTERQVMAGQPASQQMTDAEAAKKAAEWLNAPDEKGKIVGGSDQVFARQVERPAVVTAAVAPKDMKSSLSRGVVTAPLRAVPAEVAGEGQPKPLDPDMKEEFTTITPQAERPADPANALAGL